MIPFSIISIGNSTTNPRACVGDSIFEWIVNRGNSTLIRVRKETSIVTDTINLPTTSSTFYTNITSGIYQNNNYIFTANGDTSGNITRVTSVGDNPSSSLFNITVARTEGAVINRIASGTAIVYSNGYLWIVPNMNSGISPANTPIIRLNIFANLSKTTYSYNLTNSTSDPEVTVYTNIPSAYNASTAYIFGNFIFTLGNSNISPGAGNPTVITKMSTFISGASGIIASPTVYSITYTETVISSLASDNTSNLWMSENSPSSGNIYRMGLNSINGFPISQPTPTTEITNTYASPLRSILTMTYGAGYLWITGVTTGLVPSIIQLDVTTNTIVNTIPLITTSPTSVITSIDIYNEYLWMTDNANGYLLKMKIYIPCFKEGTKILCLTPQMKEEYIPIQDIRKGHLVKTSLNGFVPVCMIGKSGISNPGGDERIKNRLYKCSKSKYPELFEDLYITGCHSILVNQLSESEREKTMEALGDIFITDRKYRLMAYLDERSEPYTETGRHTIWHMALENNDYFMNYGIYANGLLVESTSKRYMKELSGLKLIE